MTFKMVILKVYITLYSGWDLITIFIFFSAYIILFYLSFNEYALSM